VRRQSGAVPASVRLLIPYLLRALRQRDLRMAERVFLAAAADEAGPAPAAALALVDAAGREVEEVVDHHLRDR
jgi:hypothetical protein